MNKYDAVEVIADTGGLGKSITEEMRQRYGLPMRAAEKTEKLTAIETLNGDYIESRIMVLESCTELIEQYGQLTWDSASHKRVENQQLRNDLCDCTLYAARMSRHYWYREATPKLTGDALTKQLERDMLNIVIQQQHDVIKERENDDPERTGDLFGSAQNEWSSQSENW